LLLLASHIAESAGDDFKVIIMPPALPPMVSPAATRMKRKRRKAAALAGPVAVSNDASAAMSMPSTAPATKKGKITGKKKALEPVDLCTTPI
jgi:hypothetical protein